MAPKPLQPPTEWDALIESRLRQVARSTADLALALNKHSTMQRESNSALIIEVQSMHGRLLTVLQPKREASRKFKLPGEGNSIELGAETRKAIVERSGKIALTIVLVIASHIAAYFGLPRPEKPAIAHAATHAE